MSMLYRFFNISLLSFLCSFALLTFSPPVSAQWVERSPNLIGQGPYDNLGAMATAGGVAWAGMYDLYKSTDQGVSWKPVALPLGGNYINDISFYDDSNGVVSTIGSGLFMTTNQGATWQNKFPGDNIFAAQFAGSAIDIVAGDASTHNFDFTTDGGMTWTSGAANIDPKDFYSPSPGKVIAFVESSVSSYIANTTDYGQTWTTQPGIMEADAHSFAAMPCEGNIIFGINEEGGNYTQDNRLAEIYLSRDGGKSFTSIEQYPLAYLAGCALITPAVVYVPTRTNGILESTDTGVTWNTANGPAFAIDCRDLVAVNDTLLLLADQNGSIWSTVDTRSKGRSFTGASSNELVLDTRNEVSASSCDPLDTTLAIGIVSCSPITGYLDSLWLTGSSSFQLAVSRAVPRSFEVRDSIGIEYAPGTSLADTAQLHIRYDLGFGTKDTSVTLVGTLDSSRLGSPQSVHREAASAYVGQLDSLPLGVDISSAINLDSLWQYVQDIQATLSFDSSVVSFSAYIPPLGWTTNTLANRGNAVDFGIHKVSGAAMNPLDLGMALFSPNTSQLATTWVELPSFVIEESGHSLSFCVTDNEDSHWAVKTLGAQSGVAESAVSTGDGIFVYPNPAESGFFIRNTNMDPAQITVYDAIGRCAATASVGAGSTSSIDIESLPQESYVVVCQIGDRVVTRRIVKAP